MIKSPRVRAARPFTHIESNFPEYDVIEQDGVRHYVISKDLIYPSVTTVMSAMTDKSFLDKWRKRVGIDQANMISSNSLHRGTSLHTLNEYYLRNKEIIVNDHPPNAYSLFKQVKSTLDSCVDNVVAMENCLVSHQYKIAGRVDLVANWNGVLSIIDFKTSSKEKKEEWIEGYFNQASLYSLMLYEMTGLLAKNIVILVAGYQTSEPQIFIKKARDFLPNALDKVTKYHEKMAA